MIRECTIEDAGRICFVVNEAAEAYRGVIPDDCWHEPYMPLDEVRREMAEMTFFGWDDPGGQADGLAGVMGYQPLEGVTLIRHAYVLPDCQGQESAATTGSSGGVWSPDATRRDVEGGDVGHPVL